nr:MAG TPA: hypothetical protein [Caudoviricetes sp.]
MIVNKYLFLTVKLIIQQLIIFIFSQRLILILFHSGYYSMYGYHL